MLLNVLEKYSSSFCRFVDRAAATDKREPADKKNDFIEIFGKFLQIICDRRFNLSEIFAQWRVITVISKKN